MNKKNKMPSSLNRGHGLHIVQLVERAKKDSEFLLGFKRKNVWHAQSISVGSEFRRLWAVHAGMKQRCYNPRNSGYKNYGARGIKMCDRWLLPNGEGLKNFLADMGPREPGDSCERIDNNGDYSPENCRWIPVSQQAKNRRICYRVTHNGETLTLAEWARKLHRNREILRDKIFKLGLPVHEVLIPSR